MADDDEADATSARLLRLRELYTALLGLPPAQRTAAAAAMTADADLVAEALRMLARPAVDTESLRVVGSAMAAPASDTVPLAMAPDDDLSRQLPRIEGLAVVDPYVLIDFVGQGGFGQVFRGRHLWTDREVAVKLLRPRSGLGSDAFEELRREARLGANHRSPNIVEVLDCNRQAGVDYLVMEWIAGEDLGHRLRRLGARPFREVLAILLDVVGGLRDAHAAGIVHRDVAPGNVLLGVDGRARITDLGLARHFGDPRLQRSMQPVGHVGFMAPEQFDSLGGAGPRADVHAVGATAYCLCTGELLPRRGSIRADPALVAAGVPEPFRAILDRCVAPVPDDRFTDGADLLAALQAAAHSAGVDPEVEPGSTWATAGPSVDDDGELQLRLERVRAVLRGGGVPVRRGRRLPTALGLAASACLVAVFWPTAPESVGRDGRQGEGALLRRDEPAAAGPPALHAAPTMPVDARIVEVAAPGAWGAPGAGARSQILLPPIPFGERSAVTLIVRLDRQKPAAQPLALQGIDGILAPADERTYRCAFAMAPGRCEFALQLGGQRWTVHVEAPSVPPVVDGLVLAAGDARTNVHYTLAVADEVEPLRFVWVRDGLLGGVTEVAFAHFAAFVASGALAEELASDRAFRAWLAPRTLQDRVAVWQRRIEDRRAAGVDASQPVTDVHACEAVAFARWSSRGLRGIRAAVPDAATWCELASANCGRPIVGTVPFVGAADVAANHLRIATVGGAAAAEPPLGRDGTEQVRQRAGLESIWSRRDGRFPLYHMGGNAAELCIEAVSGGGPAGFPTLVSCLGGDFTTPPDGLVVAARPRRIEVLPADRRDRHEPLPDLGFRLVVVTDPK